MAPTSETRMVEKGTFSLKKDKQNAARPFKKKTGSYFSLPFHEDFTLQGPMGGDSAAFV